MPALVEKRACPVCGMGCQGSTVPVHLAPSGRPCRGAGWHAKRSLVPEAGAVPVVEKMQASEGRDGEEEEERAF